MAWKSVALCNHIMAWKSVALCNVPRGGSLVEMATLSPQASHQPSEWCIRFAQMCRCVLTISKYTATHLCKANTSLTWLVWSLWLSQCLHFPISAGRGCYRSLNVLCALETNKRSTLHTMLSIMVESLDNVTSSGNQLWKHWFSSLRRE